MSDLILLGREQMRRIERFFPRPRGLVRVDDRRVISGIVYVIRNGLQSKDALPGRLKEWRRIVICYDHCAHTFFSAVCIAATVIFWL